MRECECGEILAWKWDGIRWELFCHQCMNWYEPTPDEMKMFSGKGTISHKMSMPEKK